MQISRFSAMCHVYTSRNAQRKQTEDKKTSCGEDFSFQYRNFTCVSSRWKKMYELKKKSDFISISFQSF